MVDITRSVFLLTPQQYFSHPDERRAAPCAVPSPNHNNGRVTELSDGWPAQEASRAGGGCTGDGGGTRSSEEALLGGHLLLC